jgi:hypothetical protein
MDGNLSLTEGELRHPGAARGVPPVTSPASQLPVDPRGSADQGRCASHRSITDTLSFARFGQSAVISAFQSGNFVSRTNSCTATKFHHSIRLCPGGAKENQPGETSDMTAVHASRLGPQPAARSRLQRATPEFSCLCRGALCLDRKRKPEPRLDLARNVLLSRVHDLRALSRQVSAPPTSASSHERLLFPHIADESLHRRELACQKQPWILQPG